MTAVLQSEICVLPSSAAWRGAACLLAMLFIRARGERIVNRPLTPVESADPLQPNPPQKKSATFTMQSGSKQMKAIPGGAGASQRG